MKAAILENQTLTGWLALSAVFHILVFYSVNQLYLHLTYTPPQPLIIDVSIETPSVITEPSAPAALVAPAEPQAQVPVKEEPAVVPKKIPKAPPRTISKETSNDQKMASLNPASSGSGSSVQPSGASPSYASNPKPPYPEAARRAHKEGTVLLSVKVKTDGTVSSVEISESSGTTMLDNSAQQTVLNWRFVPAMLNNEPIESNVVVPIKFQLTE